VYNITNVETSSIFRHLKLNANNGYIIMNCLQIYNNNANENDSITYNV
jgi:hypothetical protein